MRKLLACAGIFCGSISSVGGAQLVPQRITSGTSDIVNLTFAGATLGRVPAGIQLLQGNVDVVDKDGQRMLRASSRSMFLVSLPQVLPLDFTLEFDVIPKTCCNPEDVGFEGTATINQGDYSSNVLIHRDWLAVVGGGATFDQKIPEATAASTPGSLTKLTVEFQGETMKLFINGQLMHTVPNRKFVRGRVLRVFLGGQDDNLQAVYLAGLRVAAGVNTGVIAATQPINPAAATGPVPMTAAPVNAGGTATAITQPAPTVLTPPTRSTASPTALGTGPAPTNLKIYGTPAAATLQWNGVAGATGYSVQRTLQGSMTGSTTLTSTNITATTFANDVVPDPTKTYTYTVSAHQANGTYGSASADFLAPKASDPTGLKAVSPQPGVVNLSWIPGVSGAVGYLVTGPGIPPNVTVSASTAAYSVLSVPAGLHAYRVASVFPSVGTLTPSASWPTVSVRVAAPTAVTYLTVPNGRGSLAEYNKHACAAGQWLSGQQAWVNTWCALPTATSVADVKAWPLLGLFAIQEYQPRMGKDLITGAGFDIYPPVNEWTQFWQWRWAKGNSVVPEASFHDDSDLDRDRRVGCVQRGSGSSASTMCWANSIPGSLSVIVQTQTESFFLLFQDTPAARVLYTDCMEPPNWWNEGNSDWSCGKLLGIPSTNLDTQGARFAPHACLACHGGKFDAATGKVTGASLLPLDPRGFTFHSSSSRSAQEETIRQINLTIFNSQASTLVRNYITDMYRGRQTSIGATVDDSYVPAGWTSQSAIYRDIYRPYCASCHNAQSGTLGFTGWADLVREKVRVQQGVCNAKSMPHAEVPYRKFWTDGAPGKWPGVLMTALGLPACP